MAEVLPLQDKRARGGVKGAPKTPGSGRQKGTGNKIGKELREEARKYTARSLRVLARLMEKSEDEQIQLKAAAELLDRGHGKATTHSLVGGDGGNPIVQQQLIMQASQRIAETFGKVADDENPAEVLDDQSLGAVQAVNFIQAAREAAQRGAGGASGLATSSAKGSRRDGAELGATTSGGAVEAPVAAPEPAEMERGPDPDPKPLQLVPPKPGEILAFLEGPLRIHGLPPDRPNLPDVYALHGSAGLMRRGSWDVVLAEAKKQAGDDLGPFVVQRPRQQQDFEPSRPDQRPIGGMGFQVQRSRSEKRR